MKYLSLILLFILMIIKAAYSEIYLNFYIKDVSIELGGKIIPAKSGMKLPSNAIITTGPNSRAYIYNDKDNNVTVIEANSKIPLASITTDATEKKKLNIFDKFRKDHKSKPTSILAIRAEEEGNIDLEFQDNNKDIHNWKTAKELYNNKKFDKTLALTRNAEDPEGKFLYAASLYYSSGISNADDISKKLLDVLDSSIGNEIKAEANLILAQIYFETGRYDLSLKSVTDGVKYQPENEITESSYYMLIINNRITGNDSEANLYLRKMKKYYRKSSLLEELQK